jgi:arginine utilization protein RocB
MQATDSRVLQASRHIAGLAKEFFNESLQVEPFFPGLSDMSYLGLPGGMDISALTKNFPLWDSGYHVPLETMAQLNIPFMNIGPLGKDAHKYTERVCLSYSIEISAPLVWAAVRCLLGHPVGREDLQAFYRA